MRSIFPLFHTPETPPPEFHHFFFAVMAFFCSGPLPRCAAESSKTRHLFLSGVSLQSQSSRLDVSSSSIVSVVHHIRSVRDLRVRVCFKTKVSARRKEDFLGVCFRNDVHLQFPVHDMANCRVARCTEGPPPVAREGPSCALVSPGTPAVPLFPRERLRASLLV